MKTELIETLEFLIEFGEGYIEDNCMEDDGNDGGGVKKVAQARKLLESMRAETPDRRWNPIETADKDGLHVLLWSPSTFSKVPQFIGYWRASDFEGSEGVWLSTAGTLLRPTHWMPLPEPPEIS